MVYLCSLSTAPVIRCWRRRPSGASNVGLKRVAPWDDSHTSREVGASKKRKALHHYLYEINSYFRFKPSSFISILKFSFAAKNNHHRHPHFLMVVILQRRCKTLFSFFIAYNLNLVGTGNEATICLAYDESGTPGKSYQLTLGTHWTKTSDCKTALSLAFTLWGRGIALGVGELNNNIRGLS